MRSALRRATFALGMLALLVGATPGAAVSPNIVISQVYGGGGNAGSTYTNDFVELFNRGASPQSLSGWSVQYSSATGTTWQVTNLTNVTLQPGQYYLVQEAQGAGGTTPLPTPDATGTIAMSATAGKIALVNTTTALTGACSGSATIVDLIGYASTANCSETAPSPAPSNTNAVLRALAGCTDTDNNSTDFTAGAPTPRNTASPQAPCGGGPTNPSGVGAASPSSGLVGASTLLTVTVTPGTSPASTGLAVTADLSGIGQSATQSFFDDGTNGDVTPGDNVFSYQTTVGATATVGPKSLPFTITDAQSRSGNGNVSFTVLSPPLAIHDIQGAGPTSPYVSQLVTTHGIVTGLRSNGFFIQTPDAEIDGNTSTSEGVFVFTSAAPPASAAIGNDVQVTGTVQEYVPSADPLSPAVTELTSPSVSILSSGNTLPAEVTITAADTLVNSIENLEKWEGMRVTVPSLTVVSPTQGTVTETSATSTTSGVFYGVVTGVARPFREPGIQANDPAPAGSGVTICPTGAPNCVPRFDFNPERLRVNTTGLTGGTSLDVTTGVVLTGVHGILHYDYRTYDILTDPANPPSATANATGTPVTTPVSTEFTIGTANLARFYDTVDDPLTSDVVLTATAFANRLNKASLAIRNYMKTPDIVAIQEMENLTTLQALASKISADALAASQPDPLYQAYLVEGNDVGGIDVGFLAKTAVVAGSTPRVTVGSVVQENAAELFTNPDLSTALLNDRPPLRLMATINHANGSSFPITVIDVHQRSLSNVDATTAGTNGWGTEGQRVRAKRRKQAESLANLIQARQTADATERIVVLGDFNAFEVSDGYVDAMGTVLGTPTPAAQVVLGSPDLVTPDLTLLDTTAPAAEQYSYSYDGTAQSLDHILINQPLVTATSARRIEHARINADYPEGTTTRNNPNVPLRISDHDPGVAFFQVATFPVSLVSFSAE